MPIEAIHDRTSILFWRLTEQVITSSETGKARAIAKNLFPILGYLTLQPIALIGYLISIDIKNLLITRSEEGMSLFTKTTRQDFATQAKEIKDVTGAGDTVLATIAMGVGSKLPLPETCQLANHAASVAIEHVGCKPVTLPQLAERLLKNDANTKIFEEHHLFALKELLKEEPFLLIGMNEETIASAKWIDRLQELSKEKIILYLPETTPRHYLTLLASLKEITYITLGTEGLTYLCSEIGPKRVLVFEEGSLHELDEVVTLLERLALSNKV